MRRLLTLCFLISMNHVSATGWYDLHDSLFIKYKNSIQISSDYFFDSDVLTNEFALEYFNRGFITDDMKDRVSPHLTTDNRLGAGSNNEIRYVRNPDTLFSMRDCFFSFSLNNKYNINSRFSKDAFELYFRGNKDYAGKTADLDDFYYQNLVYQQINFTFGHRYSREENRFGYSAGISLIKGQRLYQITADRASIYTDITGEYLDLDASLVIRQSDSSYNDIRSVKGVGASADASFFWQTKNSNILTITAENFGVISWDKNSTYVKADTSFRFEGVDVSYLFDLGDSVRKTISLDSSLVEPYLSAREKKAYTGPVPALLKLNYRYILKEGKTDLEAEAGYLFFATALPYESVKFNFNLANGRHRFGVKLRHGGYGGFDAGLSYRILFLKKWLFSIESDYLSSMFNPQNSCGHGTYAGLSAYF